MILIDFDNDFTATANFSNSLYVWNCCNIRSQMFEMALTVLSYFKDEYIASTDTNANLRIAPSVYQALSFICLPTECFGFIFSSSLVKKLPVNFD